MRHEQVWVHAAAGLLAVAVLMAPVVGATATVSAATRAANAAAAAALPPDDGEDADFATRGFIGTYAGSSIPRDDGKGVVWDSAALDGVRGPAPAPAVGWGLARLIPTRCCWT